MNAGPKSYILPVLMTLLLHGGIVVLTAFTWFETDPDSRRVVPQYIKAELVDLRSQTEAKKDALRKTEAKKQADIKKKADAKAAAKRKVNAEAKAKERALAKEKAAQSAKQEQAKKVADNKKAEQQAAAIKQQAAAKKQAAAEQLALSKKQDTLKKAEQKRQQEAQRKVAQAERERQQQVEQEFRALEEAQRVEAQAAAEQAWAANAKQLVASAESVIIAGVQSQWSRPPSARNGMVVGVRIHLLPTGEVDDAYVTDPSGDEAFDRSAVNAVLKAERFPSLQAIDPVVFDRYLRQISLKFRPEDLRR
tara:strand:- start:522 stop:1442 length:921 start_codon:yes stop_codon:yes gene_type:complete